MQGRRERKSGYGEETDMEPRLEKESGKMEDKGGESDLHALIDVMGDFSHYGITW